jgi:hypothetical protein
MKHMSRSGNIKAGRVLHAQLKKLADAEDRSIVGQIRVLLNFYLKNHEKGN